MFEGFESRQWKARKLESAPSSDLQLLEQLQSKTGLSSAALQVCISRGLIDPELIQKFLSPKLEELTDPFLIKDMQAAVERFSQAREQKQKIRVFGDYDVDGTTGAALLSWFLKECDVIFDATQPDRFKDGYGLGVAAVEQAHRDGIKLLITVDCGISSFAASFRAKELSIDLMVIDHHQIDPEKGLPTAHAILNPQREDCPSGLKQLCGCGLAFYFIRALRTFGKSKGWWEEGKVPNLKQHLDLVVMATAADMVPLTGDNHILVRHGLEVLKQTQKAGVRALMNSSGIEGSNLSPSYLGFVIGPRINASGRMGSASRALELLTTRDPARAATLAKELELANKERQDVQNKIWDEVRVQIEKKIEEGKFKHGIVVADPGWHEGVVGIVASRVTETFRRPAAVISIREGFGKGSVRSYGGKDVLQALRDCAPLLLGFGGHRFAAGLSVSPENIAQLQEQFDTSLSQIPDDETSRPLMVDAEVRIEDLNLKAIEEIEKLGPFGPGNPEPIFVMSAAVQGYRVLKGRHLKLELGLAGNSASLEAIWFHIAEKTGENLDDKYLQGESQWAGVPELNRFRGRVTPTLRVKDWRLNVIEKKIGLH